MIDFLVRECRAVVDGTMCIIRYPYYHFFQYYCYYLQGYILTTTYIRNMWNTTANHSNWIRGYLQ